MTWRSLFWRAWLLVGRKRRYRKCLQRIAILERELFPYGFSMEPGARWIVDSPSDVLAYRREIEQRAFFGFRPNIRPVHAMSSTSADWPYISKAEWGED